MPFGVQSAHCYTVPFGVQSVHCYTVPFGVQSAHCYTVPFGVQSAHCYTAPCFHRYNSVCAISILVTVFNFLIITLL